MGLHELRALTRTPRLVPKTCLATGLIAHALRGRRVRSALLVLLITPWRRGREKGSNHVSNNHHNRTRQTKARCAVAMTPPRQRPSGSAQAPARSGSATARPTARPPARRTRENHNGPSVQTDLQPRQLATCGHRGLFQSRSDFTESTNNNAVCTLSQEASSMPVAVGHLRSIVPAGLRTQNTARLSYRPVFSLAREVGAC